MNLKDLPERIQKAILGVREISTKHITVPGKGPGGKEFCRWCTIEVPKGRRQTWCSQECVDKFLELQQCISNTPQRFNYKCAVCEVDVNSLDSHRREIACIANRIEILEVRRSTGMGPKFTEDDQKHLQSSKIELDEFKEKFAHLFGKNGKLVLRCWEVDHTIPVYKGGTSTDDNLRLLCARCHRFKTRQDMRNDGRR